MASNVRFVDSLKVGAYQVQGSGGSNITGSVDIDNNVNNYILTATGTDTINGEQNLTFDGSALTLSGSFTINGQGSSADLILIKNPAGQGLRVDNAGILSLIEFTTLPTAVEGGIAYSSNNFYVGL